MAGRMEFAQQRAAFAGLVQEQLRRGLQVSLYPDITTLEQQVDAYYIVASLPGVTSVVLTFARSSPHVVFQVHMGDSSFLMSFPCANPKRRMFKLLEITQQALSRARQETSDAAETLGLCRAHAMILCAGYTGEPCWAEVEATLQEEGVEAVVWTPTKVVKLKSKPVLPQQFKRAFQQADVSVCDDDTDEWNYELRLLSMQPSLYALGAKDGKEHIWEADTNVMRLAGNFDVQDTVKNALVVYYE